MVDIKGRPIKNENLIAIAPPYASSLPYQDEPLTYPDNDVATAWDDRNYLKAYLAGRAGSTKAALARQLGTNPTNYHNWEGARPALKEAYEQGLKEHQDPAGQRGFREYVYGRLPDYLKDLWDRINLCEQTASGEERARFLMEGTGKLARQHLFLYALAHCCFDQNEALKRLHLPRRTVEYWCRTDPEFKELLDEVHEHKLNYFEAAFLRKVEEGDAACILHAAKTQLRERGYGEVVKHEHTHAHAHLHGHIDFADLDLDDETCLKILEALNKRRKQLAAPAQAAYGLAELPAPAQGPEGELRMVRYAHEKDMHYRREQDDDS